MAVAADFHRDFLTPEYKNLYPTTNISISMNCVYSFVDWIIPYLSRFFKRGLDRKSKSWDLLFCVSCRRFRCNNVLVTRSMYGKYLTQTFWLYTSFWG